jgi:hypothetical protein
MQAQVPLRIHVEALQKEMDDRTYMAIMSPGEWMKLYERAWSQPGIPIKVLVLLHNNGWMTTVRDVSLPKKDPEVRGKLLVVRFTTSKLRDSRPSLDPSKLRKMW